MSVNLSVLHVPDCPNLTVLLKHLRQVTDLPITTREITTDPAAATAGMSGSPTLLINGTDPFATPGSPHGLSCRIYRDEHGRAVPAPSPAQLRAALNNVLSAATAPETAPIVPAGEPLAGWRARARPTDPVEQQVHRTILRTFATTSQPPTHADLDSSTAGCGRTTSEVLRALHDMDAIRLTSDGHIAVAYPFSATPTRHRVRIHRHTEDHRHTEEDRTEGERTEVYAMCAIDALGIAAMLNTDARIDSTDATNGRRVSVTTTSGRTTWDPPSAVVFLGADTGGGPSADCCCDYLNYFTNEASAKAWMLAHPHIPGQILTQTDAETLGARLFGGLLTDN